jgi:DNA-directed RNA polymerase subunit beta'
MGAECIMDLLARIDLIIVLPLSHSATMKRLNNVRKAKRLQVVESFRESNLNRENVLNG